MTLNHNFGFVYFCPFFASCILKQNICLELLSFWFSPLQYEMSLFHSVVLLAQKVRGPRLLYLILITDISVVCLGVHWSLLLQCLMFSPSNDCLVQTLYFPVLEFLFSSFFFQVFISVLKYPIFLPIIPLYNKVKCNIYLLYKVYTYIHIYVSISIDYLSF
jgi:hypothetical protein